MSVIKCYKLNCEVCGKEGTAQVFYNKAGQLKYGRVRHYLRLNESKKPQFEYHKIEDLEALKTELSQQGISLSKIGQAGQAQNLNTLDLQLRSSRRNLQTRWASSSARIEHQPPKLGVEGSNPSPPAKIITIQTYLTKTSIK